MFLVRTSYICNRTLFYFYIENPLVYIVSKLAIIKFITNSECIYVILSSIVEAYNSIFLKRAIHLKAIFDVFIMCVYGITKRFRVLGRGYKTHARAFVLSNKLGYSHLLFTVLPLQYRLGKRKRKDKLNFWRIFGHDAKELSYYLYCVQQYKIPNVYTKKGIYSWGKEIVFKEGKKAYVL